MKGRSRGQKGSKRPLPVANVSEGEKLYVFLDEDAELPKWFVYSEIYGPVKTGEPAMFFKIPLDWRMDNKMTNYAFKIPSDDPRGKYVGKDDNYAIYLKHILVTDKVDLTTGVFLILLDLNLELLPKVKKQIEESEKRGIYIEYLKVQQPAYNVLVHVFQ